MKHLRFWTTVLQGLGYAFLLIGTIVSLLIIVGDQFVGEDSIMPVRLFAIVILLSTWTFSALIIACGAYMEFRSDAQEMALHEGSEGGD